MFDGDDEQLSRTIIKALRKAVKTFYKEIEKAGYDGAFYPIKVQIFEMSYDLEDILEVLSWDNLGSTVTRHEILKINKYIDE